MPVFNNMLAGASGGAGGESGNDERSLRFNSGDSAYLSRAVSSAGNRKTFTWSGWIKRTQIDVSHILFETQGGVAGTPRASLAINELNILRFAANTTGNSWNLAVSSNAVLRDLSAWYHLVLSVDTTQGTASNRLKLYINGVEVSYNETTYPGPSADLPINQALGHRIGSSSNNSNYLNGYLADLHFIDGQALAPTDFGETDVNGVWQPKKFTGTYGTNGFHLDFKDNSSSSALGNDAAGSNNWTDHSLTAASNPNYTSNLVFTGGNYGGGHIPDKAFDGNVNTSALTANQGTDQYVTFTPSAPIAYTSSVEFTATTTDQRVSLNGGTEIVCTAGAFTTLATGSGTITEIKARANSSSWGRIAAIRVDGTILIAGNPSSIDSLRDSPSQIADQTDSGIGGEIVGNYPTFNPLSQQYSSAVHVLKDGNLQVGDGTTAKGNYALEIATMAAPPSGKWYWEMTFDGANSNERRVVAVMNSDANFGQYIPHDNSADGFVGIWCETGQKIINGSRTSYASAIGDGDVVGVALDQNANTVNFYVNGTDKGSISLPSNMVGKSVLPAVSSIQAEENIIANFGQRAFAYQNPGTNRPSADFKCLNTANLPTTIEDPSQYFDTKFWAGNSGDGLSPTQDIPTNFSPDFVWVKSRTDSNPHSLFDNIRGIGKRLHTNTLGNETTKTQTLSHFLSNGFRVNGDNSVNDVGQNYGAYVWDAGDDANPTAIAVGSLNSSAYDQSQTWSNIATLSGGGVQSSHPLTQGFNGNLSNRVEGDTSGEYLELAISTTIVSGGVRVYAAVASGTPMVINLYNGSSNVHTISSGTSGSRWHTTTYAGPITKIRIERTGRPFEFDAVEVNGKILVDQGTTPAVNVPSIASAVRANPSAGFSIVSYQGSGSNATIGHGLNAPPAFFFGRNRDDTSGSLDWIIYHQAIGNTGRLKFNIEAVSTSSAFFQNTSPSNSVISIGPSNDINKSGDNYIIYAFSEIANYSSMGKFTGNGSDDGPFCYCGFKPALIFTKAYSSNSHNNNHWLIWDTLSDSNPHNEAEHILYPNLNNHLNTHSSMGIDILSNGFKLKADTSGYSNYTGWDYMYFAVAENPFKTARAR